MLLTGRATVSGWLNLLIIGAVIALAVVVAASRPSQKAFVATAFCVAAALYALYPYFTLASINIALQNRNAESLAAGCDLD